MKKILISAFMLIGAITLAQGQTLKAFFEKYQDDERLEYVSLNNGIFNMIPQILGAGNEELKHITKMNNMKILTAEGEINSGLREKMLKELLEIVKNGNFENDLEARDKGERVNMYHRVIDKEHSDMLIISREEHEFSCIWISGKMSEVEIRNSSNE